MPRDCDKSLESLGAGAAPGRGHPAHCPECSAEARVVEQLRATRTEPDARVLTGFAARLAARREERRAPRALKVGAAGGALAAAALAAGVLLAPYLGAGRGASPPAGELAAASQADVEAEVDALLGVVSDEEYAFGSDGYFGEENSI